METVEVSEWDQLEGKTIRVRADHNKVRAIGNIIKDEWFDPGKEFEKLESDKKRHI
jgi:hypothetical protein